MDMIYHQLKRLQEIVDLLEGKERRVRTPDGVRKFDQPIGSVIKDDKIPDIKKPTRFNKDSVKKARDGALAYSKKHEIKHDEDIDYQITVANRKRAEEIADAYDALPVYDEKALPFYDQLAKEIEQQYEYMTKELGIEVEFVPEDPYKNSKEMFEEVSKGKLRVLDTKSTGSHPYLTDEQNNKFRAVHDFFGHAATGRGFGQDGEESAWIHHSQMFTMDARAALTTETRGQNSWYNTRKNGFAQQKTAILPSKFWVVPDKFEKAKAMDNSLELDDDDNPLEKYTLTSHVSNGRTLGIQPGQTIKDYEKVDKKITPGSKPSKPSERVTGSERNKPNSASRGGSISFGEQLTTALKNKVKDHNAKMREKGKPTWTYANLRALKAVARRGAGAFSTSHRPGMTRNQWAIARVNAFLYLLEKGKPKRVQYTVDYDLLPSGHPKASRGKKARMTPDTNAQRSAVNDKLQDALEDAIEELDLTKELSDEEIQALFDAFEDEDWTEVDRLTEMFEKRGTITADMVGEEKAGGIDRNRGQAENLRRYWTVGKGALKIRWGTEGDWTRCVRQLSKYLGPRAKGYCSLRHKEMNGIWPGDTGVPGPNPRKSLSFSIPIQWDTDYPEDSENQTKDTGAFMLEHKTVGVKGLNVVSEEEGIVETIISVTGIVDEVKDRIMPGAYAKTLAKRKPKGVWSHDWDSPVSKTLGVKELLPGDASLPKLMPNGEPWPKEAGALAVKTQFNLQTQRGKEAYADVVFFGDEQEWSIGYNVPVGGAKIDQKSGVREISTLELYEYSPVLFGAMPLARTTSVKEAQLALKQLRGGAASWLASQSTEVEIPEAEEGKEMGMLEDETDEMMDTEEKERMLSGEQMDLVKQAIEVLREILDVSQGEEKGYGKPMDEDEQDEKMGYGEDESDKKEIIGFDTLTEAIDTMVSDANLPQKMLEGMNTAAGAFDEAMKTKNMDALDVAGNQLLDMVENAMEGADDKTKGILRGIAVTLAEFIKKVTEDEDSQDDAPMDAEPVTEENVQKKETVSIPLDELKNFLDSMKSE